MFVNKGMRDQTFIIKGETKIVKISQNSESETINYAELEKIQYLQIPRKPPRQDKSLDEQKQDQNIAFLEWRKQLGFLQDSFPRAILTPYEKNFEVWKQLWYVVEKSDILIQIIDCRDPLFYWSEDLQNYVKELKKNNFLLINKSDLVPESARKSISEYLKTYRRSHIFFSAKQEQEKLECLEGETEKRNLEGETEKRNPNPEIKKEISYEFEYFKDRLNTEILFNRMDLIKFFEFFSKYKDFIDLTNLDSMASKIQHNGQINNDPVKSTIIGMVGYPNVGKSSVINTLCGKKKVGVDSKPGKTKNMQTIIFSPAITLCDCPGLIFPSLVSSKAEMICNGVISVETIMEYIEPINYILQTVPNLLLKYLYKLPLNYQTNGPSKLDIKYNAQFSQTQFNQILTDQNFDPEIVQERSHHMTAPEFLQLFAGTRGYVTGAGLPDEIKAAKSIIKDYVIGKIPHFKLPEHNEFVKELEFEKILAKFKENAKKSMIIKNLKNEDLVVNEKQKIESIIQHDLEIIADIGSADRQAKIEFLKNLNEDDIVNLIEGKKIDNIKLNKMERRELKWLVKKSPPIQQVIDLLNSFLFKASTIKGINDKK